MTSDERVVDERLGRRAARRLAALRCCVITPGLTDAEFRRVEETYGVRFAPEHRAFLAEGLPVSSPAMDGPRSTRWPDWRHGDPAGLRRWIEWPMCTIVDDVRSGDWHSSFGGRPDDLAEAVGVAESVLAAAPTLVPVYGHRFLPSIPDATGYPVLSVWGSDIIIYGSDLATYIDTEFGSRPIPREVPPVPFWSAFLT